MPQIKRVPKGKSVTPLGSEVVIIVGRRGFGKSTWLRNEIKSQRRFLMYNTLFEETYSDYEKIDDFIDLTKRIMQNPKFFRINYHHVAEVELDEDFERFIRAANFMENISVGVEEIDLFTTSHSMPIPLQHLVAVGRHQNNSLYVTTRRPYLVHPLIRSQANKIIVFKTTELRDIDWLIEVIGPVAKKAPHLKRGQYIEWTDKD